MKKPDEKLVKKILRASAMKDPAQVVLLKHIDDVEERLDKSLDLINKKIDLEIPSVIDVISRVRGEDGEKGDLGDKGDTGEKGEKGDTGEKGEDGLNGRDGRDGRDGLDGKDGINGINGNNGKDGKDGVDGKDATLTDEFKKKLELVERIPDIERIAKENANSLPITTTHFYNNGQFAGRAKNINIVSGGTVNVTGDQANISITGGSGGGGVNIEIPTGTVDGTNTSFTVSNTPKAVSVDGLLRRSGKGYTYSAGTITVDPLSPPTYDIFTIY